MPTLKPTQRKAIEDDLEAAQSALTNPEISQFITDKASLSKQVKTMKDTLDREAPKPYGTAAEKDTAMLRERELREQFTDNMPSVEEMRKNRDGSPTKHLAWEKKNKKAILEWREIRKRLEPDSDDDSITSYEKYRPERPFAYDANAQISGHHAMSEKAKENYPEEMAQPKATTAISHMKEVFSNIFPAKPETEVSQPTKEDAAL